MYANIKQLLNTIKESIHFFLNRIIDPLSNLKKYFNFPFCNQLFKAQDTLSYWFLVPQHHALKAFSLGSETTVKKSRG